MAHTHSPPETLKTVSVDPAEMKSFSRMAADWWDPSGPFKPLHIMNGARLGFIKDTLCEHFHRDPNSELPLKGLRILDIGCGGGLLCEPLTRLGARMTGVDALERNLKTAKTHAEQMGLDIDYRHGTIEQMVAASEKKSGDIPFDAVLNMEVIEHVANPPEFMKDCGAMVREGGIMFCSTINRTLKAFTFAILGAEYILGWLPKGTHQYRKFVKPEEIQTWLKSAGLSPQPGIGMSLNPVTSHWRFSDDLSINYVTVATA
ncbi:bifunctional 2-polyprenyl-6-hydroxyphenol methylase/3-demethylubiquinol 3-O-methyltransferase UbiG [Hellea balneolensis]|uniref:bifunctional 2-polyprenyl-6-hydroxyphenol methylase/3-demethylubiquinol 3-O-methyltransferase UbiG n=1 Tax=Hellea balneolensis TaxID=287478 RepID=UPI0004099A47|nr:bifunctional 2-polyprenyl-6-hydroxyphenol methylase/3-demethylubiquinol 3-O-methyltransferase UbiG [Hellea balneolensis]